MKKKRSKTGLRKVNNQWMVEIILKRYSRSRIYTYQLKEKFEGLDINLQWEHIPC
jgi:hypothetical protein